MVTRSVAVMVVGDQYDHCYNYHNHKEGATSHPQPQSDFVPRVCLTGVLIVGFDSKSGKDDGNCRDDGNAHETADDREDK